MPTKADTEIITAAILGFEQQKRHINSMIDELRALLSGGPTSPAATPEAAPPKRKKVSAAARRKMALAQKARWAQIRRKSEPTAPATSVAPKPKRRLSAAGRKAIIEATKKRWAVVRAVRAQK